MTNMRWSAHYIRFKLEIFAFIIAETYIWKESFHDDIVYIFAEIELNVHWAAECVAKEMANKLLRKWHYGIKICEKPTCTAHSTIRLNCTILFDIICRRKSSGTCLIEFDWNLWPVVDD